MKWHYPALCACFFVAAQLISSPLCAQLQNDKVEILQLRNAYNAAIKNFSAEQFSFLTNDVLTTTGNGTLIRGKENLKKFLQKASVSKMYWVRTPSEIDVNTKLGLAWEMGTWKGYNIDTGDKAVVGGKYSAQWAKINGVWKIKSQLFVTLE
jgi:ketosteroid isomerase-like protein